MKILVRAPQWLGDAVVSTIFLSRLKVQFPSDTIDVLSQPYLGDLYKSHSAVSGVAFLPYKSGGSVWTVAAELRRANYDQVYILPRSFRSAMESWLGRIPKRIGHHGDWRDWMLTDVIPYDPNLDYPHRYLSLIGEQAALIKDAHPHFPKASPESIQTDAMLQNFFSSLKSPVLGIGPASIAPARTWQADRFAATAQRFIDETKGSVILFGTEREKPVADAIAQSVKGSVVNAAGKLNLSQLGFFMSACTLFIGNDSGLMHVASAFQIPTVVLFGASDPNVATPLTGRFEAIQHREIECVPCLRNECKWSGEKYKICLKSISVEEAFGKLQSLLGELKLNTSQ